jgi:soluble lytic murein transglycosylase-like protein
MAQRHPCYFDRSCPQVNQKSVPSARVYNAGVEQWRPVVEQYFPANQVATAMRVMRCESGGNPGAVGKDNDIGLFQHLARYWQDRSQKAGWAGASAYDPTANVAVAAWLQRTGGWSHWSCY